MGGGRLEAAAHVQSPLPGPEWARRARAGAVKAPGGGGGGGGRGSEKRARALRSLDEAAIYYGEGMIPPTTSTRVSPEPGLSAEGAAIGAGKRAPTTPSLLVS